MVITKDLGAVSAYAYAVEQGYQGTEEEFAELMARQASVAEEAAASADAAAESATNAQASAEQAERSAQSISGDVERAESAAATATDKATEAGQSATAAAASASAALASQNAAHASETASAQSAQSAASSSTAAESSATDAEQAKTDAQAAQAAAEAAAQSVSASAAQIAKNTADIADLVQSKAGALIDTATGSIASFYPDATVPNVRGLTVDVEPVQDLHGYDSPWPSGGGKNKLRVNSEATSSDFTADETTGVISIADISTVKWVSPYIGYTDIITGQTYTLSATGIKYGRLGGSTNTTHPNMPSGNIPDCTTSLGTMTSLITKDRQTNSFVPNFTGRIYWFFCTDNDNAIHEAFTIQPQLELGSTATSWTPYSNICPISGWDSVEVKHSGADRTNPTTYQIQLGQTVYGGTIDAVQGVLTVDRAMVDMTVITDWSIDRNTQRIYKIRSDMKPNTIGETVPNLLSNRFQVISLHDIYTNTQGVSLSVGSALQFHIDGLTDNADVTLAEINQWFTDNPTTVVYELATPITIDLTPLEISVLTGQTNNIWADSGNVSVEYAADLKTYIDQKIAAAVAALS